MVLRRRLTGSGASNGSDPKEAPVKVRLPDRHDAAVLLGLCLVVVGVAQVAGWLACVIAGLGLAYIGIATEQK